MFVSSRNTYNVDLTFFLLKNIISLRNQLKEQNLNPFSSKVDIKNHFFHELGENKFLLFRTNHVLYF